MRKGRLLTRWACYFVVFFLLMCVFVPALFSFGNGLMSSDR